MSATLQQIAGYLDNRNFQYDFQPNSSRIITGFIADKVEKFLIISLKEDRKYLELTVPQLLQLKNYMEKGVLFQTMLVISWETKMLRWEYDPIDEEVCAAIEFPLEDALLTERQFNRCLGGLIQLVDSVAMPRLNAVMETGVDPGEKELGERLLLAMQEILPDNSLTLLEQALAARKPRGTT